MAETPTSVLSAVASTELDAINSMLVAIGRPPVSSLDEPRLPDVSIAISVLSEVNREVQEEGWAFNTQTVTLHPDNEGNIDAPAGTLRLDSVPPSDTWLELRDGVVYDLENDTDEFTADVECVIVRLLDFAAIPENARRYITAAAARRFQQSVLGSPVLDKTLQEREYRALASLRSYEIQQGDYNMLNASDLTDAMRHRTIR